jgi:hypothetical protein
MTSAMLTPVLLDVPLGVRFGVPLFQSNNLD